MTENGLTGDTTMASDFDFRARTGNASATSSMLASLQRDRMDTPSVGATDAFGQALDQLLQANRAAAQAGGGSARGVTHTAEAASGDLATQVEAGQAAATAATSAPAGTSAATNAAATATAKDSTDTVVTTMNDSAASTGARGRAAFEAAKDPNNWVTQAQVAELDRIPGYDIPMEDKITATHRQAQILGWSAADLDAYYGKPDGTHAGRFAALDLAPLKGDGKVLTRYDNPALFTTQDSFSTRTYADGQIVDNPDGSFTVFAADSFGNIGGTTYNPDGSVRDPGGPRATINQAIALQRAPWLESSTGPAHAGSKDALRALAADTSGYTGARDYTEMANWLRDKSAALDRHNSQYLAANGRSSASSTDGYVPLAIKLQATTPEGDAGSTSSTSGSSA